MGMERHFKDLLNRPLLIGARVVMVLPNYSGLVAGYVVKINPKSVTVEYINPHSCHRDKKLRVARSKRQVVRL